MTDAPLRRLLAPVPGGRVRKPDGQPLADGGEFVEIDFYWRRLLASGDVSDITPVADPDPKKPRKDAA